MTTVVENAEEAHKEILEARSYQKSTAAWLKWLVLVILVIVIIIILSTTLGKK